MKYEVHTHAFGRPLVKRGPMQGLRNYATHRMLVIARNLGLQSAIDLCDAQPHHAAVTPAMSNHVVHDNGKPPELPKGWLPA